VEEVGGGEAGGVRGGVEVGGEKGEVGQDGVAEGGGGGDIKTTNRQEYLYD
jgi:hypothetical protein